jgi:hypothetical protein
VDPLLRSLLNACLELGIELRARGGLDDSDLEFVAAGLDGGGEVGEARLLDTGFPAGDLGALPAET